MDKEIREGYTRVTEILHPYSGFDDAPQYVKDKAAHKADIGTEVHNAIHMHYSCIPFEQLSDEAQSYFNSFLLWDKTHNPTPVYLERRYYDGQLMITGQVDAILRFVGKKDFVMVDWKTTSSYNKKIATSWELQGTFYRYLLEYNSIDHVGDNFLFLQLDAHGEYPKEREFTYTAQNIADCMAGLQFYRRFHPIKEKK